MRKKQKKKIVYPGVRIWAATKKRIDNLKKKSGASIPYIVDSAVRAYEENH